MRLSFKALLTTIVWLIYFMSTSMFQPVLTQYMALNQLQDTITSNTAFQTYQQFSGAIFLIPFIFTLLMFATEIQNFIKRKKGE